jgi:hypothetical protein
VPVSEGVPPPAPIGPRLSQYAAGQAIEADIDAGTGSSSTPPSSSTPRSSQGTPAYIPAHLVHPPHIAGWQRALFELRDTIQLSLAQYELLWPYASNF